MWESAVLFGGVTAIAVTAYYLLANLAMNLVRERHIVQNTIMFSFLTFPVGVIISLFVATSAYIAFLTNVGLVIDVTNATWWMDVIGVVVGVFVGALIAGFIEHNVLA